MSDIDNYPNLKDELLDQMVAKAITITGDFFTFQARCLDQRSLAHYFLIYLSEDEKKEFASEIDVSKIALDADAGLDQVSFAFGCELQNMLLDHIQENFVDQMQNYIDEYWASKEYE